MTVYGFTIAELTGIFTLLGVFWIVARGIVTKKDCKDCKVDIDKDLEKGSEKFEDIKNTQIDHGEQLAGISATLAPMAASVQQLVSHHIGGSD